MGRIGRKSQISSAGTRKRVAFVAALGMAATVASPVLCHTAWAQEPAVCTKAEFESAVDEAAMALRDLNNHNRPNFQTRLSELKEKRGWSDDQFLKEAAPFVQDDKIAVFDEETNKLLASISTMGTEGASASEPDCAMLAELRSLMKVLIDKQAEKWAYMFEKLDAELAK